MKPAAITNMKLSLRRTLVRFVLYAAALYASLIHAQLFSQSSINNATVHGFVKDSLQRPLQSVTISLTRLKDSVVIKHQLSGKNGAYSFLQKDTGAYYITASLEGYATYKSNAFTISNSNIVIPDIILFEQIKKLNDVAVTATKKAIEISAGKLIMNVEQSAAAVGSSAFELLQRTPGITVDQNDYILLKGSATINVMIDGKMTYLSAQQLSNTLKSIPAENISRIEIINTPSAQYDAAGNSGIINIITKKSNKAGYAANISAGIGFGHYVLTTENFTGNIKTRRFNFFGNFGYDFRHNYKTSYNHQITDISGSLITYDKVITDIIKAYYYSYKAGADIYLSKRQQIGFVVNGSIDNWSRTNTGPTILSDNIGQKQATVQNNTIAKEPYYNNAYNFNYQWKPDTTGKLFTADANYISYRNNSDGYIANELYDKNGTPLQPYQQLSYHQPSNVTIRSVKADMEYPVLSYNLKAGLKYSSVTINNDFRYDSLINGERLYVSSLSDHFIYTEKITAAYLSVAKQWKKTNIEFGLRAEHTYSDGNSINLVIETKRNYFNLFPTLTIDEELNTRHKLSLAVSRRINRPGYSNLNPVRYFFDKYSYYQGNPYLVPEQSWVTSLSYAFLDKYIATVDYRRINKFIGISTRVDTAGVLIQNNINYPYANYGSLTLIVPVSFYSFWNVSAITGFYYNQYPLAQINNVHSISKLSVDVILNQTFSSKTIGSFELNTHYSSPELNGDYLSKHFFSVDGGYKKSLLKTKLDFKCGFTDLFHTNHYQATPINDAVHANYKVIRDSRRLRLTLTYHLGGKLSSGKSHSIEEENRL